MDHCSPCSVIRYVFASPRTRLRERPRTADGWAQVDYGNNSAPIPRARYEENGYQPPFDKLPLEADYRAAQRNAQDDAKGT